MATTPNPLIWDYYRKIDDASGLGVPVEYYNIYAQSLYLDDGLQTRLSIVQDGHWSESVLGDPILLSDTDFSQTDWDHPINTVLYGCGISDGELYYLRYRYLNRQEL